MAATNEDIANSALAKLGAELITSLSDTTRRAVLINRQFNKIRDKLLRSHPWNFAITRSFLSPVTEVSNSVDAGTDTFTATATLSAINGDKVTLTLNSGTLPEPLQENTSYFLIYLTTTTFQLAETQALAQAGTPIDVGAATFNMSLQVGAQFEYERKFIIPTDCLRAIREEDKSIDWKIENDFLVTNEDEFNLVYIQAVTDPTKFDASFDEMLATELAYELAYPLVQSMSLKEMLKAERDELLKDTRSFDAQEGTPEEFEADEFLLARR